MLFKCDDWNVKISLLLYHRYHQGYLTTAKDYKCYLKSKGYGQIAQLDLDVCVFRILVFVFWFNRMHT